MEKPRPAQVEEFADIMRLVNLVFRGSETPSTGMEEEFPLLFNRDNLNHLYIIRDGQQIVAHVGAVLNKLIIYGAEVTTASVGSVCTHPRYRGKGYASRLLSYCSQELNNFGANLVIVSGDRDLYRRANCYPAGEIYQYKITKTELDFLPSTSAEIRPLERSDLDIVKVIYEHEPVRFCRPTDTFEKLISVPHNWMEGRRDGLIIQDGESMAYLFLLLKNKDGIIWEFSGDRKVISYAIPKLFEYYQLNVLILYINAYDHKLAKLLADRRVEANKRSIPDHSLGVINFVGLMRELRPYFLEHLGIEAPQVSVKKNQYMLELCGRKFVFRNQADLVRFLFGPQWEKDRTLGNVFKKAFPIPVPWPGLNFV